MRIKLAFLFLILVICTLAYDPVKSKKDKPKKSEIATADEENIEEKTLDDVEKDAGFEEEEEEPEDEEEDVPKKKVAKKQSKSKDKKEKLPVKKGKLEKPKKSKKADDDEDINEAVKDELVEEEDQEYQACNFETSGDSELCHCDLDEINCGAIVMDADEPHLQTTDLQIMKKDFKPVTVNFSENAIRKLQKGKILPGFEKYVSVFTISHNQIRYIDSDAFKPFTNMSKLDLSYNNLQEVKKPVFDAVKATLHRLDLGYNRIKSLPDNVFDGLTNLKTLSLDGNVIKVWRKEMFKGLDNLQTLSLDNCKIDDLPADIFEYLPKLEGVSLRGNPLDEIPSVVANLKSLKRVDMSATNLTEIRYNAFAGDADLERIILEKMPFLSAVRDCGFCGLPKLKALQLNDNSELMEIHPNAFGFIKSDPGHKSAALTELAIHNSNLTTISEHMIDYDKLESFKVGGNPWNCNCDTKFLLQEQFSFKQDSVSPKCAFPEDLKDRFLGSVSRSDACEADRLLGRSARFSSVMALALLTAFLALGTYYMVSTGKLRKMIRNVRKEPEVTYTNLQAAGEDFALESDFQPRPAEV